MNIARVVLESQPHFALSHTGGLTAPVHRTADEVRRRVAQLCHSLETYGVAEGDAILIIGGARVEIVEVLLSTFNLGAVAIPVSPLLGSRHLAEIIVRFAPKVCIFEEPPDEPVLRALRDKRSLLISIRMDPPFKDVTWIPYAELFSTGTRETAYMLRAPELTALIVHGSGSSGSLKAIRYSHLELLTFLEYNRLLFAQYSDGLDSITSSAATVSTIPLSHLAGLGNCLLSMMNGQNTCLLSAFTPRRYLQLVDESRCAHILLVPSHYRSLLAEPYLQQMDKSALRFCIVGGEPCPTPLRNAIESAFGIPLLTAYSMTECLSGIGHLRRDLFGNAREPGSCGRQLFGEVSLRDPDGAEQSHAGELWVRNATVHECYFDPALNSARIQHGWFKTGDLFFRDAAGNFFHRGRADDMFVCNGKNLYPSEIEEVLALHPDVKIACAAPVGAPETGFVPGALVVATVPVTQAVLQTFFASRGQAHAIPRVIVFCDALPLLGPGKIDRREVQTLLQQHYNSRYGDATQVQSTAS